MFTPFSRWWLALGTLALVLTVPSPSQAQATGLSETQAMRRALRSAPAVHAARSSLTAHHGVSRAAGGAFVGPPRVDLSAGARRSGPADTGLELSLGAWQDIAVSGLGDARRGYARALTAESRAWLDVVRRDTAARAALAWVEARTARELLTLRMQIEKDAAELERIVAARVNVGRAPPSELSLAQSVRGRAHADVLASEGRLHVAEVRLRFLAGLRADSKLTLSGPLVLAEPQHEPSEIELVKRALARSPALAHLASAPRTSEALARSTLAAAAPPIAVGPSISREGTGDLIFLGRVSFPLPTANPAAFEAARLRANAASARAELARLRTEIELATRLAYHERYHARDTRNALWSGAVLPAREALREANRRYEAGEAELALVLTARRELSAAQERWTESAADVRRADVELWQLTGWPPRLDGGWSP